MDSVQGYKMCGKAKQTVISASQSRREFPFSVNLLTPSSEDPVSTAEMRGRRR